MSGVKPLFRWAGSKKKVIQELKSYWNDEYSTYIEPFAGSAQLFFAIEPTKAIINDLNEDLITTYKVISKHPMEVFNRSAKIQATEKQYYIIRSNFKEISDPIDKAAAFVFLNRNCFNGLYRVNKSGDFNVPFSKNTGVKIMDLSSWLKTVDLIQNAQLYCMDFEKLIIKYTNQNDFVYIDPPYAISNRKIFTQYNNSSFGVNDLERLKNVLNEIDNRGARFVLSYAKSEESEFLADGWKVEEISINRNISGFSRFRRMEQELIISNI